MERRLAAILAADVVGYSRLMGQDESATLARLDGLRAEIIDPLIAEHRGRVVKLMGDGFLVEFASVVDALTCALAWQEAVETRASQVPADRALRFRIGLNLGDLMVKRDDVFGDGVNVAARLETMAEPGSILVSRTVFDHAKGKVPATFEDLGKRTLKNIEAPVQVFRASPAPNGAVARASVRRPLGVRRFAVTAIIFALLIAAGGSLLWLEPWEPRGDLASEADMAFPLPDKPSVAVLPFANMSNNSAQEYFADGMTDDLITDLSKVSGLFVIARNSTFAYKGRQVKVGQVAEELGVRYVLEGSVRRAGGTVRVNAQLIDATTGGHVWADRYDGDASDVFGVQDTFVRKIVEALQVNLAPQEADQIGQGQTDRIAAREAFQKGWEFYLRFTAEDNAEAIPHLKKAVELDPQYGRAYALLGLAYLRADHFGWIGPLSLSNRQAEQAGLGYLESAKKHPTALLHVAFSLHHLHEARYEAAFSEVNHAISLDPNETEAYVVKAWVQITDGRPEEALQSIETAMRLNPKHPNHYVWTRGLAYFAKGDFERAARELRERLEQDPQAKELAPFLASAYALLGRREDARAALQVAMPLKSQRQLSNLPDSFVMRFFRRYEYREIRERLFDGLNIAALPLDVTVSSLVETLREGSLIKRLVALERLARFGPMADSATPALIEALDAEENEVRRRAMVALAKIGPGAKEAIPALEALRGNDMLGTYANDAIRSITAE